MRYVSVIYIYYIYIILRLCKVTTSVWSACYHLYVVDLKKKKKNQICSMDFTVFSIFPFFFFLLQYQVCSYFESYHHQPELHTQVNFGCLDANLTQQIYTTYFFPQCLVTRYKSDYIYYTVYVYHILQTWFINLHILSDISVMWRWFFVRTEFPSSDSFIFHNSWPIDCEVAGDRASTKTW